MHGAAPGCLLGGGGGGVKMSPSRAQKICASPEKGRSFIVQLTLSHIWLSVSIYFDSMLILYNIFVKLKHFIHSYFN